MKLRIALFLVVLVATVGCARLFGGRHAAPADESPATIVVPVVSVQ